MKHCYLFAWLIGVLGASATPTLSQNLEQLKKPKELLKGRGISIKGSLSLSNRYYNPFGSVRRQVTSVNILTGQLTVDILGQVKMPISFAFSDREKSFSGGQAQFPLAQSFNRFTLKPTYKGHTLHIGTGILNFSPFTLAGHRFEGLGYEFKNGKFPVYGGLMVGTLLNAIRKDTLQNIPSNRPAYKRTGVSGKLGYKKEKNFVELSLLSSQDVEDTRFLPLDRYGIVPRGNLAFSLGFSQMIRKNLSFNGTLGRSSVFSTRYQPQVSGRFTEKLGALFGMKNQYSVAQAIKVGLEYKKDETIVGFQYSKIDPNYETFGAYFFVRDLETYDVKSAFSFFEKKLALAAAVGLQQNNLQKTEAQKLQRWVGSFDATYTPSQTKTFSLSYSTFQSATNFQNNFEYLMALDPFRQIDTLNYRQINQNLFSSFNIELPKKGLYKRILNGNAIYQGNIDQTGTTQARTRIVNGGLNYIMQNDSLKLTLNVGLSFVKNSFFSQQETMVGPVLVVSKSLIDKVLDANFNASYMRSDVKNQLSDAQYQKNIFVGRLNLIASIAKKHKMNISATYLRTATPKSVNVYDNFAEFTFQLGYVYNFSLLDLKIK